MTIEELISRLEKAKGPDRELDGEIHIACGLAGDSAHTWGPYLRRKMVRPAYTSSIDAALRLKDKILPGWFWRVGHGSVQPGWAHLNRVHPDHCDPEDVSTGWAASPALALCVAILRAAYNQTLTDAGGLRSRDEA